MKETENVMTWSIAAMLLTGIILTIANIALKGVWFGVGMGMIGTISLIITIAIIQYSMQEKK